MKRLFLRDYRRQRRSNDPRVRCGAKDAVKFKILVTDAEDDPTYQWNKNVPFRVARSEPSLKWVKIPTGRLKVTIETDIRGNRGNVTILLTKMRNLIFDFS